MTALTMREAFMTIDWQAYFQRQKQVRIAAEILPEGFESSAEEIRYQAFKARMIEELSVEGRLLEKV
jgi:hypothetical protein